MSTSEIARLTKLLSIETGRQIEVLPSDSGYCNERSALLVPPTDLSILSENNVVMDSNTMAALEHQMNHIRVGSDARVHQKFIDKACKSYPVSGRGRVRDLLVSITSVFECYRADSAGTTREGALSQTRLIRSNTTADNGWINRLRRVSNGEVVSIATEFLEKIDGSQESALEQSRLFLDYLLQTVSIKELHSKLGECKESYLLPFQDCMYFKGSKSKDVPLKVQTISTVPYTSSLLKHTTNRYASDEDDVTFVNCPVGESRFTDSEISESDLLRRYVRRVMGTSASSREDSGTLLDVEALIGYRTYPSQNKVFRDDRTTSGMAAVLLLDRSGSMKDLSKPTASACRILSKAFYQSEIDLEVWGYLQHNGTKLLRFAKEEGSYEDPPPVPHSNTPTNVAIRVATERLNSSSKSKKCVIVVTDGSPRLDRADEEEVIPLVQEEVLKAAQRGIKVLGIVLGREVTYKRKSEIIYDVSEEDMTRMFGSSWVALPPHQVDTTLVRAVSTKLLSALRLR